MVAENRRTADPWLMAEHRRSRDQPLFFESGIFVAFAINVRRQGHGNEAVLFEIGNPDGQRLTLSVVGSSLMLAFVDADRKPFFFTVGWEHRFDSPGVLFLELLPRHDYFRERHVHTTFSLHWNDQVLHAETFTVALQNERSSVTSSVRHSTETSRRGSRSTRCSSP